MSSVIIALCLVLLLPSLVIARNTSPVPCEWYPANWPNETAEDITNAATWWQHDPDGVCAVEVPANAPTLPPTDTVR